MQVLYIDTDIQNFSDLSLIKVTEIVSASQINHRELSMYPRMSVELNEACSILLIDLKHGLD